MNTIPLQNSKGLPIVYFQNVTENFFVTRNINQTYLNFETTHSFRAIICRSERTGFLKIGLDIMKISFVKCCIETRTPLIAQDFLRPNDVLSLRYVGIFFICASKIKKNMAVRYMQDIILETIFVESRL